MSDRKFIIILCLISIFNIFAASINVHDFYCWKIQSGKYDLPSWIVEWKTQIGKYDLPSCVVEKGALLSYDYATNTFTASVADPNDPNEQLMTVFTDIYSANPQKHLVKPTNQGINVNTEKGIIDFCGIPLH